MWGRTGRWAAGPERSTGGRTAPRVPASELPGGPGESCESPDSGESGKSLPAAGAGYRGGNGQPPQRPTEVITQCPAARTSRRRQRTHHHQRSAGQRPQPAPHQMAQPALHPVPDHGTAHRATDHETHPRRRIGVAGPRQMHDYRAARRPAAPLHCRREVVATGQSGGSGQQRRRDPGAGDSGRQLAATLEAPRSHDGAPGTGAHPQPEPVSPRAATVVRLERALALGHGCRSPGTRCSVLIAGSQLSGLRAVGQPLPAPAALLRAGPTRRATRTGRGESTQDYPPVGGRPLEPRRPMPAPSKRASRVTVGATRRYFGDACYPGVLVAEADAC